MSSVNRVGAALVLAAAMAGGLGTTSLEAKGKHGGDAQAAICEYLTSVITYPYVSAAVLVYATSLYNYYGCGAE
jgi:hypothetical protein